jgi:hypothetical protein
LRVVDRIPARAYPDLVKAVEFAAEDPEDEGWQEAALLEFAREDDPEDSVYDSL